MWWMTWRAPVQHVVDDVASVDRFLARIVGVHVFILRAEVAPLEAVDGAQVVDLAVRQPHAVQVLAAAVAVPDADALVVAVQAEIESKV